MGFFSFLKQRDKSRPANDDLETMLRRIAPIAFPNGKQDIENGTRKLMALTGNKLSFDEAIHLFTGTVSAFFIFEDPSRENIIQYIKPRANGKLDDAEIERIYDYMFRNGYYIDGAGTYADPVVIKLDSSSMGIRAEYMYVAHLYGRKGVDWNCETQALVFDDKSGRRFDQLTIKCADGREAILYFDITNFFGKY